MNEKQPKAYKVGYQDFYGHDFLVTPDVLIPRPETEAIIDIVLGLYGVSILPGVKAPEPKVPANAKILDVGTGSGCIAISLKLKLPEANVTACDISDKALDVAKKNAENLGAQVNFVKSVLTHEVGTDFDIIVANLPYVDPNWEWLDKEALDFEPSLALYANDYGLGLIKKLIEEVANSGAYGFADKYLVLEADPCQHDEIKKYAEVRGLRHIKTNGFALLFGISA